MKTIAVHQPNFLPWLGYFYKMSRVDQFVIQDNVDFESGNAESVTNRARIKGPSKIVNITVPVKHKTPDKRIMEIRIDTDQKWAVKQLNLISNAYQHAPFFKLYFPEIKSLLLSPNEKLSNLNINCIHQCCNWLEIKTPVVLASQLEISGLRKSEQLVAICRKLNANAYLSGNGARKYNDQDLFDRNGLKLLYSTFKPLPYMQQFTGFIPGLSVIDALFNLGPQTIDLLRNEESTDSGI